MGLKNKAAWYVGSLLVLSACAASDGPVAVDAEWNLTCPAGSGVGCGSLGDTCLGQDAVGQRTIVGARGQTACDGSIIDVTCEALRRPDGTTFVSLRASAGDDYELDLDANLGDGTVEDRCNVTIVEDGLAYDLGACGTEPPSMEQPCQLSDISTGGGQVAFGLECESLISTTTANGFDVGAVGGGPAFLTFSNCAGL